MMASAMATSDVESDGKARIGYGIRSAGGSSEADEETMTAIQVPFHPG